MLPVSPSWPPPVVDHAGGFAAIGAAPVAAGDSPHPSTLEIPVTSRPASALTQQARRRTSGADGRARPGRVRARSGPRRRGEGSLLDSPDGRTEGDQAGRVRADVRHGVARAASHRHAPAGSRSGAAVSPSRSRLSSSSSSFPRRAARGAAAASFTPPAPRPRGWAADAIPAVHHVEAMLQTRREDGYTRTSRVVLRGNTPCCWAVLAGPVPGLGSPPRRRRPRSADRQQVRAQGHAPLHAELAADVVAVKVDRARRPRQRGGDVLRGQAAHHQMRDVGFGRGQGLSGAGRPHSRACSMCC